MDNKAHIQESLIQEKYLGMQMDIMNKLGQIHMDILSLKQMIKEVQASNHEMAGNTRKQGPRGISRSLK